MKTAVIILNRNLPKPTNLLYEYFTQSNPSLIDVYVVEAGSDEEKISNFCTWHVNDLTTRKQGLRFNRGMNYALVELLKKQNFMYYDTFLFCTNDTIFTERNAVDKLNSILVDHAMLGLIAPCSTDWGEITLLQDNPTKYFWSLQSCTFMVTRKMIEKIGNFSSPSYLDFFFDGVNFRGYMSETEIIAKGYINNFASAITSEVKFVENETYLIEQNDLIKTESKSDNYALYIEEGNLWMRNKYGFNSKWDMDTYSKTYYDSFFIYFPNLKKFSIL